MNINSIQSQKQSTKSYRQPHCKNGHELKDPNLYYYTRTRTNRIDRLCKLCSIKNAKEWIEQHPEQHKETYEKYYKKTRLKQLNYSAKYYRNNKEHLKKYKANWYQDNKERVLKLHKAYRDRIKEKGTL